MKNRRDICLARDAGAISYPGLPGHIKTGCVASPAPFYTSYVRVATSLIHENKVCLGRIMGTVLLSSVLYKTM